MEGGGGKEEEEGEEGGNEHEQLKESLRISIVKNPLKSAVLIRTNP